MCTKMPRYIIYIIQYKFSSTNLIILDIRHKIRIRIISPFHNDNRPTKKFTPKLLEKLEKETYIFPSSIEYFTKDLQNKVCWDTSVNMKKLVRLINSWEKIISTGVIETITKLHIIP